MEMAVRRFGYWQERLLALKSTALPPLDVLLVWATYLGSPIWYHDDSVQGGTTHPQSAFPDFPLESVIACIDPDTLDYQPVDPGEWKAATGTPFDPIVHFESSTSAAVNCPGCRTKFSWPWILEGGKGYAQCLFVAECPTTNCRLRIDKEAMGVGRLARRIADMYDRSNCQLATRILTGGLLNHPLDIPFKSIQTSEDKSKSLCKHWRWRRSYAFAFLVEQLPRVDKREISRLSSAFVGAEEASIDLAPATFRHIGFIDTLKHLGWLNPSTWVDRSEALYTARLRYAKFMNLARSPNLIPVPTLGIEIIWQTHMLASTTYRRETQMLVGRVVDRDEAVEESVLAEAFTETAEKWKASFHVPYTTSGMLLPLPLSGLAAKVALKLHWRPRPRRLSLDRKVDYDNPIVYAVVDSTLSLPCERNSIALIDDDKARTKRALRREEYELYRVAALQWADKGKVDPALAEGLRNLTPAFMTTTLEDAKCGPGGFPCSPSYLTISGNHISGKLISSTSNGMGIVGAGLWRGNDAELAKMQPSTSL